MVETVLDQHPELSERVELASGELPLNFISLHPSSWDLLIYMVLFLYPKALVHRYL